MSTAFAAVVKKHRQAKGISQELLAEKSNLHPTYVSLIERSLRVPSITVAKALADGLGLPLTKLVAEAEQISGRNQR